MRRENDTVQVLPRRSVCLGISIACLHSIWQARVPTVGCGVPTVGCRVPTVGCGVPTVGCRVPTVGCGVPTVGCRVPTVGCRAPKLGGSRVCSVEFLILPHTRINWQSPNTKLKKYTCAVIQCG